MILTVLEAARIVSTALFGGFLALALYHSLHAGWYIAAGLLWGTIDNMLGSLYERVIRSAALIENEHPAPRPCQITFTDGAGI